MSEDTKIVHVAQPKQNTAKVTESELPQTDLGAQDANRLVRKGGERLKPFGSRYLGSAVVHYYQISQSATKPIYEVRCQVLVSEVPEGFADVGHKRLRAALMRAYGRDEPRIRQVET